MAHTLKLNREDYSAAESAMVRAASSCAGRPEPMLDTLAELDAGSIPVPGRGDTLARFCLLADLAAIDVAAARTAEPHLDALAILAESGCSETPSGTWGVFAAEGPDGRLSAHLDGGSWTLSGEKPWCSLGTLLTDALVTAYTGEATRRLFRVSLRNDGVRSIDAPWVARGLAHIPSGPLEFDRVPAEPVGADEWYTSRPGFQWGGIGVAACWWGGAVPLARLVIGSARRRDGDTAALAEAGRIFRLLESTRVFLENTAHRIDDGVDVQQTPVLAHAVRGAVADAVAEVLKAVDDVLGPAVLAFDEDIARRCADLQLYVMQFRRGREDSSLGRRLDPDVSPW
jgi:alkylation response protein AidB-like acyl-CoA dehydrogenase